MRKSKDDTVDW